MNKYLLENMTAKEAAEAVKKRKIVVLPVGTARAIIVPNALLITDSTRVS